MEIRVKRIYEPPEPADGYRLLVDRLWPRGVSKDAAALDDWMKEVAPSTELRKWFNHDAERWHEFKRRYCDELRAHQDLVSAILLLARDQRITLVYSAQDPEHNQAIVLAAYLGAMSEERT